MGILETQSFSSLHFLVTTKYRTISLFDCGWTGTLVRLSVSATLLWLLTNGLHVPVSCARRCTYTQSYRFRFTFAFSFAFAFLLAFHDCPPAYCQTICRKHFWYSFLFSTIRFHSDFCFMVVHDIELREHETRTLSLQCGLYVDVVALPSLASWSPFITSFLTSQIFLTNIFFMSPHPTHCFSCTRAAPYTSVN